MRPSAGSLYYASFIPGLQEFIAETVRERLHDVVIHRLLDGAILFETSLAYDRFNFLCFNNIFAVAGIMEHTAPDGALEAHISAVIRNSIPFAAEQVIAHNSAKFRTFRIVISCENTPAAINEKLRLGAEQYIAQLSGLKVDRARPDAEFWFLYRHDHQPESTSPGRRFSVFMKRLTMRPSWEKSLHPGELPPPLAWTLCRLGNLKHGDIVFDPFCGYGSIPSAALKYFHITRCIACDSNEKAAAYTAARHKSRSVDFVLHKADFRSLASVLPEKSVDAIITDPPWGHYQDIPVTQLYEDMFRIFDLLLKTDGRVVILGGRTDALLQAAQNRFALHHNIPILLSGKKATIYSWQR
ncbi:MAG: methyltransferase domain-containing protein [Treponema sp.]|jgi:tRNA G10  N-methylase Trm11|nr:methyltransferase domain-containing protein [Treponema sp.]